MKLKNDEGSLLPLMTVTLEEKEPECDEHEALS